jgi:ribonuclease PH
MNSVNRPADELRPISIEPFPTAAPGSVLITMGQTRVLCTASIDDKPPPWLPRDPQTGLFEKGWVTAEYSMLPGSTPQRKQRKTDGRSTEIQRLIARALRAAVDLTQLPGVAITCDCDVLYADGGTRTAAITGAYVALAQAVRFAQKKGLIEADPLLPGAGVAAVSVGIIDGVPTLDLDYPLDVRAEVDMNVVMNAAGKYIEVQGTGEQGVFDRSQLDALLDLAGKGIERLLKVQQDALR